MARIRKIEIENFRAIKSLTWFPTPGINCLIGPGDAGKSTILDGVDFCLGARRNIQFTDSDFHQLDVNTPIKISVTIGELDDGLKSLDAYGMYVRSYNALSGVIEDEPDVNAETVLTIRLTVESDLEPSWSLVSDRAEAQGQTKNLVWGDRARLAPTRLGVTSDYHLSWRRGSVLNRISEERADASAAMVQAARDARTAFDNEENAQLKETLETVAVTAKALGIRTGDTVKAMLDAQSVSFSGGAISLHDHDGIPLRGLGTGSARLLIAGLQQTASAQSTIFLVDELEYGLEPHRIIRLLGSLGAKDVSLPLQVFVTTHSPVALRELSGNQLFVVRGVGGIHNVQAVGTADEIQSTIRLYPDAFLAPSVIICEGASEVGLIRGIDQYWTATQGQSINAYGAALVDCGGGEADRPYTRAASFQALGYRTAIVRDADKQPTEAAEINFVLDGGMVVAWQAGRALEDELFMSLTNDGVRKLINLAVELHGEERINQHIQSVSDNAQTLASIQADIALNDISLENRQALGMASRRRKAGWFKSVTWMEGVGRDIVGPDLANSDPAFKALITNIFTWAINADG